MTWANVNEAMEQAAERHRAGDAAGAQVICTQVLAGDPRNLDALRMLAILAQQAGRWAEAAEFWWQAILVEPNDASLHAQRGSVLWRIGRLDESLMSHRNALAINPGLQGSSLEAAMLLERMGDLAGSKEAFEAHIRHWPEHAEGFYNLGNILVTMGRPIEAIEHFRRASELKPRAPEPLNNMGNQLQLLKRTDEALAAYERTVALRPDVALFRFHLAGALQTAGRNAEAIEHLRKAVELDPTFDDAGSALLMLLHYSPDAGAEEIHREHLNWARRHAELLTAQAPPHANDRDPARRLRIGYVSGDFREHPVAMFLEPILAQHDHGQVEVICYSNVVTEDPITGRFRGYADRWERILGASDADVAARIRGDLVDVLVDLSGHTTDSRLLVFARRPAPVQVTYLGYPNTTGLSAIDWRITDRWHVPEGTTEKYYSEKLYRMPRGAWCWRAWSDAPSGDPPALSGDGVMFGSLNALGKMTPQVIEVWARILSSVGGSRLMIPAPPEGGGATRLRTLFWRHGISPQRLELVGTMPHDQYIELFRRIDIGLDPFPFNGHTTTCNALWMGVPVVTLEGQTHVQRAGVSVLSMIGLSELVAGSPDEYVQKSVELALDLPRLTAMRRNLREQMKVSALRDETGITRDLETAYREMWQAWCRGG